MRENGTSLFMQKFATAYAMYFNKKNVRTGALFEGRFRSTHVKNDNYLKYLLAYIHLNPVKLIDHAWKEQGIVDIEHAEEFLAHYPYSSYFDYLGNERTEKAILNRSEFPEYFEVPHEFKDFIHEWLAYGEVESIAVPQIEEQVAVV